MRDAVAARTFREDLYYCLAAFPIHLPPLRERREDIPLLAASFLEAACQRHHKDVRGFHPAAIELLGSAMWPGNVRELQNEIERTIALAQCGEAITPAHLSPDLRLAVKTDPDLGALKSEFVHGRAPAASSARSVSDQRRATATSLREARANFEARYIAEVLAENDGSISRAALALGISRVALHQKMKEYGLR